MIGRRGELAQLVALMAEAGEGNGGAVLVRGDPGIGKSTLLQEIALEAVSREFSVAIARVLDFGATRETQAAASLCAHLLLECTAQQGEAALAAALASGDLPRELALFAADLLSLPRSADDLALYRAMDEAMRESGRTRALQALLAAAARRRPQLIIVEDVHWADDSLLRTLSLLAAGLAGSAAMILMSSRARRRSDRRRLARPSPRRIAGDHRSPAAVGQRCRRSWRASCRPTPRITCGAAWSARRATRCSWSSCCAAGRPTRRAICRRRCTAWCWRGSTAWRRSDRRAIETAAILGQRFNLGDLRALTGEQGLRMRRAGAAPPGPAGRSARSHSRMRLIRDGVYASLTHERRAQLHRAAAALVRRARSRGAGRASGARRR